MGIANESGFQSCVNIKKNKGITASLKLRQNQAVKSIMQESQCNFHRLINANSKNSIYMINLYAGNYK